MKNKTIVVPILNDEYKVIVCWGGDKYVSRVGKKWGYNNVKNHDRYRGTTYRDPDADREDSGLHPLILIPRYPKKPEEFGALAHEATHAVVDIFSKIEENISRSGEVFGHSVGAVVRKVLEK